MKVLWSWWQVCLCNVVRSFGPVWFGGGAGVEGWKVWYEGLAVRL